MNVRNRVQKHVQALRSGKHYNLHLQRVYSKYETLEASVLEYVDDPADLILAEQYWIDTLDTHKNGLNLLPLAYRTLGARHTEAAKAKISAAHTGKRRSPSALANMSAAQKGKRHSELTKAKMSLAKKGKRLPDSTRANMSAARKGVPNEAMSVSKMTLSVSDLRLAFSMALGENTQDSIANVVGIARRTVSDILALKAKAYVRAVNTDAYLARLVKMYNEKRAQV